MTVSELKKLFPISDVAELNPNAKYIITVSRDVCEQTIENLNNALKKIGVHEGIIVQGEDIVFYELKG